MDRSVLEDALRRFEADAEDRRVVARQAADLADAGRLAEDLGVAVTVEFVIEQLADAPDDHDLRDRWNWWIGSLELSHGGYQRFTVRRLD